MTVQNIFDFLNQKFPVETALGFDNVGILVGDNQKTVKNAVIALDCTTDVINTAIKNNCQLIITHHPVIFNPLKNVLKGSIVYDLIKNDLSVISMHTNVDIGNGGVNDSLCEIFSPKSIETVLTYDGFQIKKCAISPVSSDDLATLLKEKLNGGIKYVATNKLIENILVCGGSGGNYINEVLKYGADALITADVKHNHFIDADRLGVALFDAGHFNTEDVVIEPLKNLLEKEFSDINFITNHFTAIKNR